MSRLSKLTKQMGKKEYFKPSEIEDGSMVDIRPLSMKFPEEGVPEEWRGVGLEYSKEAFFYVAVVIHWAGDDDDRGVFRCQEPYYRRLFERGKISKRQRCPFCEYHEALSESNSKGDRKTAGELRPKVRMLFNGVIDGRVMTVQIEQSTIIREIDDLITMHGDIGSRRVGRSIILKRTGQKLKTKYTVSVRDAAPVKEYTGKPKPVFNLLEGTQVLSLKRARRFMREAYGELKELGWK